MAYIVENTDRSTVVELEYDDLRLLALLEPGHCVVLEGGHAGRVVIRRSGENLELASENGATRGPRRPGIHVLRRRDSRTYA